MAKKTVIYPGSFDPLTNGHFDVVKRSLKLFDKVYIAVSVNIKKNTLFTSEERVNILREVFKKEKNVEVITFEGLVVELAKKLKVNFFIRGLRAFSDFDYEFQMALTNRKLDKNIDTVFVMTNVGYSFISSSAVKEIIKLGGNIDELVPNASLKALKEKLKTGSL